MAALPYCLLDPTTFLLWPRPMGYDHLQAIKSHVSIGNCPLPHTPLKELVFDGPVTDTTPLVLACHYGELESVKYLVDSSGVDPRVPATYYVNPFNSDLKIDSATPLFVAAFRGYSKIVRLLLEKGACANVKTSNEAVPELHDLTPLYGAVSNSWIPPNQLNENREERNSIVLTLLEFGADPSVACVPLNCCPIWMIKSCGVDTTRALINHGMDLKLQSDSGTTVLHHWASLPSDYTEEDSLAIVKLLVNKGANLMANDNYGLTPILIAAGGRGLSFNLTVLDYLLERGDIGMFSKIEAMELAGASILCNPGNATLFPKAFDYWIRAEHLRQKKKKRSRPYRKKLGKNSGGPVEWITWDQLERVIQHPSEYIIQSYLVKTRILSGRSLTAVSSFVAKLFSGPDFLIGWAEENFVKLFEILGATLDTFLHFLPTDKGAWPLAVLFLSSLVRTLRNLKIKIPIFKRSFLLFLAMDKSRSADDERDEDTETEYTKALFSFLVLLLNLSKTVKEMPEWLGQLLYQWGPHQLGSILLQAFQDWEAKINHRLGYFIYIQVLLICGADPNVFDKDGDGPLHFLARIDHDESEAVGCLLLGFGAQLHRPNKAGKMALDVWKERNEKEDDEGASRLRHRPDWCRTVPKLQCLSARCARVHKVPYSRLPIVFQSSIQNH